MKKIALVFALIFLCGCNSFDNGSNVDTCLQKDDIIINEGSYTNKNVAVKPIIVGLHSGAYIVGGLKNGEIVNFQSDDNYKLFNLTGMERYTLFFDDGELENIASKNFKTYFVPAVGAWETMVCFDETNKLLSNNYIGIGNSKNDTVKKELINNNGSFIMDFDKDGSFEKIIINKTEPENTVEIILENQQGKQGIALFTIDDIYTDSYNIFVVDIDEDSKCELIICLYGHSYSTEIYDVTSYNHNKILWYYMDN